MSAEYNRLPNGLGPGRWQNIYENFSYVKKPKKYRLTGAVSFCSKDGCARIHPWLRIVEAFPKQLAILGEKLVAENRQANPFTKVMSETLIP